MQNLFLIFVDKKIGTKAVKLIESDGYNYEICVSSNDYLGD